MTLRPAYALGHSEYNAFLFAAIDEGEVGIPLTVLSALSRLDFDPWQEAARLAALPRDVAVRALAETIAGLPGRESSASGSQATAARLVNCLPKGGVPIVPPGHAERGRAPGMAPDKTPKSRLIAALPWAAIVVALFLFFFSVQSDNNLEPAARDPGQTERSSR
jgi:hypothetical protein